MDIKNLDKNLIKKLGIILGIIVAFIIIIIIIAVIINSKLDYNQIETKMIDAAKNYYKDNNNLLPTVDNGTTNVSTDTLVEKKYLKSLDKIVKNKDAACSGSVTATKTGEFLLFSATLNCGEYYETKKLKDVITNESNIVSSGDGLYKIGDEYIFRGEKLNNYVSYAGKTWRILRINNDGAIRLIETTQRDKIIWDDRYNSDKQYSVGINDYSVSRIRDSITDIYNDEKEFTDTDKTYIVNQNLCTGKRSIDDNATDGSIECSSSLDNQPLGLVYVNEFTLASIDQACNMPSKQECINYNYLSSLSSFWTLTADKTNTFKVFKISGNAFVTDASNTAQIRLVVNINSQVNYDSGDGSLEKPYIFK